MQSRRGALLWMIMFGLNAVFGVLGCGPAKRADGAVGLLAVGAPAPEVVGYDLKGTEVRLSALAGKQKAAVYFYPKDATPGCTTEACAFRDAWGRYTQAGVAVIGVSTDSPSRTAPSCRARTCRLRSPRTNRGRSARPTASPSDSGATRA